MVEDEKVITWYTPRPAYMREIEPLAVPGAWDSKRTASADYVAAKENRRLLEERKITARSYEKRATAIVLGKTA
jgi:hypothetical protein